MGGDSHMTIAIVSFQKQADSYKVQVSHSRFRCDLNTGVRMSKRNLIKTLEANPQAIWIDQDKTFWFDLVDAFGMPEIQGLNKHKPSSLELVGLALPQAVAFAATLCLYDMRQEIDVATRYHGTDQTPMSPLNPQMSCYSIAWIASKKCSLRNGIIWQQAMILRESEIQKLSIPGVIV